MERSPTITSKLNHCQDCDTEFYYSFILRLHRDLSHTSASADINTLTTSMGERSEDTTPRTEIEHDNRHIHENTIGELCDIVFQISKSQWTNSNAIGTDIMNCYQGLLAMDARIKNFPDTAYVLACSQDIRSELEQIFSFRCCRCSAVIIGIGCIWISRKITRLLFSNCNIRCKSGQDEVPFGGLEDLTQGIFWILLVESRNLECKLTCLTPSFSSIQSTSTPIVFSRCPGGRKRSRYI
ncbi:hypothetical protein C8Q75DRAFT_170540 [Abortiporus biennis]|nr:hypothetical protein C8Q75DRAFT_170540 [Abortiporus biennis]